MNRPLRILTFTTLYPSSVSPSHGIFIETRLRKMIATGTLQAKVVAPVPWFPSENPRFGSYANFAKVPSQEVHNGIEIVHPRYPLLPKVGMTVAPLGLAVSGLRAIKKMQRQGYDFDLLDAHYYYPDGVAAAWIAKRLGKPLVISARGTDLNLIPEYRLPKRMIRWAEQRADASITVCEALRDTLIDLDGDASKTFALRNGVDLETFRPLNRERIRNELDLTRPTLISVGHFVTRKGNHLLLDAMQKLPGWDLMLVGDGPEEAQLRAQVERLGLQDQVRFMGRQPQEKLVDFYNAADCLVLASSREGMANVLLESLACGTPVVASRVWGSPEVIADKVAGRLLETRDGKGIAEAVNDMAADMPDRDAVRQYAKGFSWEETVTNQLALYAKVVASA